MSFVRHTAIGSTGLLALLAPNVTANPATAAPRNASAAGPSRQTVVLANSESNKVATLYNGSSANGTAVVMWPVSGTWTDNQKWEIVPVQGDWFQLQNKASKTCLANPSGSVDNGTNLVGYACNKQEDQLWSRVNLDNGFMLLTNKASGKCISRTGQVNPIRINQQTCYGTAPEQRWYMQFL